MLDEAVKDMLGNKVLGYPWNATSGSMAVSLAVNASARVSVANGFLDFMGIAYPFSLQFKLMMKDIFEEKNISSWNDTGCLKKNWD